ncbi:MAG: histidine kinase, partial [Bacteroidetes bacterium]|nr:histidine kinase [Bacteroidota bacterium]
RGPDRRDVILLHPDDIKQNGLTDGARVTIAGPAGRMPYIKVFGFERIKPGSAAMYFPEANILLDRSSDPKSRTPAFKGTRITLHV